MKVTFELTVEEAKEILKGLTVTNDLVLSTLQETTDNEPDWDNAPEWAAYWAIDKDGRACWYKYAPNVDYDNEVWNNDDSEESYNEYQYDRHENENWTESLRKRP